MNVYITGRKIKITPEIRSYIEKKMKKLDHYTDHIYDFKLVISKERHIYFAEVNIKVKRKMIHIFSKTEDIHSVLDNLFDKVIPVRESVETEGSILEIGRARETI